jgi:hypothetical protein
MPPGKLIDVILEKSMVSEGETRIDYATTHLSNGIYMAEIITPEATKRIKLVSTK